MPPIASAAALNAVSTLGPVRHVAAETEDRRTRRRRDPVRGRLDPGLVDVQHGHRQALTGQPLGDRRADTPRTTGHDGLGHAETIGHDFPLNGVVGEWVAATDCWHRLGLPVSAGARIGSRAMVGPKGTAGVPGQACPPTGTGWTPIRRRRSPGLAQRGYFALPAWRGALARSLLDPVRPVLPPGHRVHRRLGHTTRRDPAGSSPMPFA